jgi:hypothetical protein
MQTWTVIGVFLAGTLVIALLVRYTLRKGEEATATRRPEGTHQRKSGILWALIALAIAYSGLLGMLHTLTGRAMLDGGIGVALGLYICAHPAANAVNMLFFERYTLRQAQSEWALIRWLALNLAVLLAGWMVVFVGIRRLMDRPP